MSSESRAENEHTLAIERSLYRCRTTWCRYLSLPYVLPTLSKHTCPGCAATLEPWHTTPPASEQPSDTRSASE